MTLNNHTSVLCSSIIVLAEEQQTLWCGTQCGHIRLWDSETAVCLGSLEGHRRAVLSVRGYHRRRIEHSSAGRLVACSAAADGTVRLWCWAPRKGNTSAVGSRLSLGPATGGGLASAGCITCPRVIQMQGGIVHSISLIPWQLPQGQKLPEPRGPAAAPLGDLERASERGLLLVTGSQDTNVRFRMLAASNLQNTSALQPAEEATGVAGEQSLVSSHMGFVYSCDSTISRDSRESVTATAGGDGSVFVWRCEASSLCSNEAIKEPVLQLLGHTHGVMCVGIISAREPTIPRRSDRSSAAAGRPVPDLDAPDLLGESRCTSTAGAVAGADRGNRYIVVSGSQDGTLRWWRGGLPDDERDSGADTGAAVESFEGAALPSCPEQQLETLWAGSRGEQVLSLALCRVAARAEPSSQAELGVALVQPDPVHAVCGTSKGRIAVVSLASSLCIAVIDAGRHPVQALAARSPQPQPSTAAGQVGTTLVSGDSSGRIRLWSLDSLYPTIPDGSPTGVGGVGGVGWSSPRQAQPPPPAVAAAGKGTTHSVQRDGGSHSDAAALASATLATTPAKASTSLRSPLITPLDTHSKARDELGPLALTRRAHSLGAGSSDGLWHHAGGHSAQTSPHGQARARTSNAKRRRLQTSRLRAVLPMGSGGPLPLRRMVSEGAAGPAPAQSLAAGVPLTNQALIASLRRFVAMPSVSSDRGRSGACWACARFLASLMLSVGGDARLLQGMHGVNPLVIAEFAGNPALPAVTITGHYDVQPIGSPDAWRTPPFTLTGVDGWLYGRGSTDMKGPLVACVFAVARMRADRGVANCPTVRFCVEGEGENGSNGLVDSVRACSEYLANTGLILHCNSLWLGDDRPCLTYGMRGHLMMRATVSAPHAGDAHAGREGGCLTTEPMSDLVQVLGSLTEPGSGRIAVPEVWADVVAVSPEELELYSPLREHHPSEWDGGDNDGEGDGAAPAAAAPGATGGGKPTPALAGKGDTLVNPSRQGVSAETGFGSGRLAATLPAAQAPAPTASVVASPGSSVGDAGAGAGAGVVSGVVSGGDGRAAEGEKVASVGQKRPKQPDLAALCQDASSDVSQFMSRWRFPSLTVHGVTTSTGNPSLIPRAASATISVRTVPDMRASVVFDALERHMKRLVEQSGSPNTLTVELVSAASWWLRDPSSLHYRAASEAIKQVWGVEPLFVREGGTLRVTPFLEEFLGAPAMHLPLGQSSDSPHLPNERISVLNLVRGAAVIASTLGRIADEQLAKPLPAEGAAARSAAATDPAAVTDSAAALE